MHKFMEIEEGTSVYLETSGSNTVHVRFTKELTPIAINFNNEVPEHLVR